MSLDAECWSSIRNHRIDVECFNSFMLGEKMKIQFAIQVPKINKKLLFVIFAA